MKSSGIFRAIQLALGIAAPEPKARNPPKTRNGSTKTGAAILKRAAKKRNMVKARSSRRFGAVKLKRIAKKRDEEKAKQSKR